MKNVFCIFLAFLSLFFALAGFAMAFEQNFLFALISHFLAAITGGKAGEMTDKRRIGKQYFTWIMAFLLPLLGGITAFFLMAIMKNNTRNGTLIDDYSGYLSNAASYEESVAVSDYEISKNHDLVSLADVLDGHFSDYERRIAIEYLMEMETQESLEILRKAAASPSMDSHFIAMMAIRNWEDKLYAILKKFEESTENQKYADAETILKVAKTYFDFVYYQFAINERKTEYLKKCEELLLTVLEKSGSKSAETKQALVLLGRVKMQENNYEMAIQYFNDFIAHNKSDAAGYLWRAECWHKLGNHKQVKNDCRLALETNNVPENMLEVLEAHI